MKGAKARRDVSASSSPSPRHRHPHPTPLLESRPRSAAAVLVGPLEGERAVGAGARRTETNTERRPVAVVTFVVAVKLPSSTFTLTRPCHGSTFCFEILRCVANMRGLGAELRPAEPGL